MPLLATSNLTNSHPLIVQHLYQIADDFSKGCQTPHIPIHDTDFPSEQKNKRALNSTIDLGPANVLKGLIPSCLITTQKEYADEFDSGIKNISIWAQLIILALMNFSVNIWKIRSTIYHNTHVPQTELNIRQEAYSLLINLKSSPVTLPVANRNLLNRNRRFFFKSAVRQIHAWVRRVNTAVKVKKRIDEKGKRDIRKFCYRIFGPINVNNDFPATMTLMLRKIFLRTTLMRTQYWILGTPIKIFLS